MRGQGVSHRSLKWILAILILALFGTAIMSSLDAYEWLHGFTRRFGVVNLDDIVLSFLIFLLMGLSFLLYRGTLELEHAGSQRQQTKRSSHELPELFQLMVEAVKDYAIFVLDREGHVMSWNRGAQRIKGYGAEEILGQHLSRFYTPEDIEHGKVDHALKVARMQGSYQDEGWRLRKDGSLFWAQVLITAMRDDREELVGFCELTQDLTERKQAEEKLSHQNRVLRAVRNVSQLIVKEKDRDRLLQGVCDNLIHTRGYYTAWIVFMDENFKVSKVAEAGSGKGFFPMAEQLERGEFPHCIQKALMQLHVIILQNRASGCPDCPLWKNHCTGKPTTVRLEHNGKFVGFLAVFSPYPDREEQSLLEEVGADVAYALHNLEGEEKRNQAEGEFRNANWALGGERDGSSGR